MSEERKEYINILKEIFHYSTDNSSIIFPIIKNPDNVKNFKEYMNNKHNTNKTKILLLKELKILFDQNDILILYFVKNCYIKSFFFYYPIINLYLSEDINEEDLKFLEEFLILINSYITLHKQIFDFIYQKLSKFFSNRNKKKLNRIQFIRYLCLLKIFYKDTNISGGVEKNENNENNIIENRKSKIIKNYIYFSGYNNGLTFFENDNPTNGFISFPCLNNGISFIFWFNIKKDLLDYQSQIYPDKETILIELTVGEYTIKLIFKEKKIFILKINEIESNKIIFLPNENEWNFLNFVFNPKRIFNLIINNTHFEFDLSIPDNFPMEKKINSIKCFENFLGKISSILFFSFYLEEKIIIDNFTDVEYLSSGFYKNKVLFRFLCSHKEKYFIFENNYKYKDLYKNEKFIKNNFNFESKNKKLNNLINLFCPFAYDKEMNQLDDIFGNYLCKLSKNDGVNYFLNYAKDITKIGDINNLLPIAELMLSSMKGTPNPSYTLVEKDILSEQSLLEFLNIIKIILYKHKRNIKYVSGSRFISNLSLFLERFPNDIFTEKILKIFIDIEKEINKNDSNKSDSNKKQSYNEYYINLILFNEKIFSKFAGEKQNKYWQEICQVLNSDSTKLENYINILRIFHLISFYDKKRKEQFCCSFHANLILKENEIRKIEFNGDIKIMKPKMEKKVESLFNIIQLYIDKLIDIKRNENDNKNNSGNKINNLYQVLCLDLSPCIQKKIIQVYINHFNNPDEKISKDDKLETLKNLFRNDFIEITEYVLSISLIDVRHLILNLFITILNNYFETFISFYHGNNLNNSRLKNIMYFIGNNPLPNDIKINLDENKDDNYINKTNLKENDNNINDIIFIKKRAHSLKRRNKQLNKKSKYLFDINLPSINSNRNINDEIYEKEIKSLNSFLSIWVKHLCDIKKEINPFIIDLLTNLSKKLSINYIYKLSFYLLGNFIDTNPKNTESKGNSKLKHLSKLFSKKIDNSEDINENNLILTGKKIIYQWIVDTILFFKIFENIDDFSENYQQKIYSIQSYTIEVFKMFFNNKKEAKELNWRIKYLFDYLTYMKNYYKNKKEKLEQMLNIARELIEIIFKYSEENVNIKTSFCFRFIIFFKNCEKLFNINLNNKFLPNEPKENIIENKIINNDIDINTANPLTENNDTKDDIEKKENSLYQKTILNSNTLIPDYILEGLYLDNNYILNPNEKTNLELEIIWKDFSLCNAILEDYQNRLWCKEHLCSIINVSNKGDLASTAKLLLKKYGNKNDKKIYNILFSEIMELFTWSPDLNDNDEDVGLENKKGSDNKLINFFNDLKKDLSKPKLNSNTVNILYINIILLSIEVHVSKNEEEKNKFIIQYQQFLIFCILASINISPLVKEYDFIQNILYNVLGYGFYFLKLHSEEKYNELIQVIILPMIDDINQDYKKSKIKTLFGIQYNLLFKNSGVFKLFVGISQNGSEKTKDKDNQQKNSNNKVYFNFNIDITKFIKEIFESTLNVYKNYIEKNPLENIVRFYEKSNDDNTKEKRLIEEKNIITKKIKELILLMKLQTKEKNHNFNNKYKVLKKNYKKKKAELFSWKGFWSDRFLFFKHPEYLKYKIKNHYTEGMFKVLLTPILDVKYYLPNFSSFNGNNLFHKNDYKYNINMNIDEILQEDISKINKDIGNENKNENLSKDTHKSKYLESIYKNNYEGIWELYNQKGNKSSSNNKLEKSNNEQNTNKIDINKEKNQNFIIIENKNISKKIKYLNCCLVKSSHHIKGKIKIFSNYFSFSRENNEFKSVDMLKKENENDPQYDKLFGCCFGSYFKSFLNDKDKIEINYPFSEIKYIFTRVYFYHETALEIYTSSNKSYFFNFKTNEDMNLLLNNIISQNSGFVPIKTDNKRTLGYAQFTNEKEKKKIYYISKKQEDWQNYRISTLEYLMWLNIYSGRSFNDITQYPVLPWTIIDFEDNDSIKKKRDFSLPMGMIEIESYSQSSKRKEGYLEIYQNTKNEFTDNNPNFDYEMYMEKGEEYFHSYNAKILKMKLKEEKNSNKVNKKSKGDDDSEKIKEYEEVEVSQLPYIYGSHYSNPLYISHYLVRIFPFSFISIQIHGDKFDDPFRMFFSIKKTFECVCTLKEDVRELIPEFYSFPEMLININNLDLYQGKEEINGKKIMFDNVSLPSWSENNSAIFIAKMRNFMENNSDDINKWIDLIFGANQRGENAEFSNNLFMAFSYEKMVKIDGVKDPKLRETLMRFTEIGITPFKLFFYETKERNDIKEFIKKSAPIWYYKDNFLYDYKKLCKTNFFTPKINTKLNLSLDKTDDNFDFKIIGIKQMNAMNKNYFKIITSSNYWYEIKNNILKLELPEEESVNKIMNNSSYYTASYSMFNLKKIPLAIYSNSNCEYLIKGGFWDGRLEINDLTLDSNNITNCIFSENNQPIILLKISTDTKYLFCGTYCGLITIYEFKLTMNILNIQFKKNIFIHTDEITDISSNSFLNMFASVSKDGYLFLFTLPELKLVRAIKISHIIELIKSKNKDEDENFNNVNQIIIEDNIKEKNENNKDIRENKKEINEIIKDKKTEDEKPKDDIENNNSKSKIQEEELKQEDEDEKDYEEEEEIYADNVFLSSSPLPCVTIYISKMELFITLTLNGQFVSMQKEENNSKQIISSEIIKSLTSQEFLIYGTDNGYIKIRRFPDMKFIGENIKVTNGDPIETLAISKDNRYCLASSKGKEIYIINDINNE